MTTHTTPFIGAHGRLADEPVAHDAAGALEARHAARLRQLIADHHDFLWRALRRLGVPHAEVDDALQSVFVIANDKLDGIEIGRERAYLFGIAVRVGSNARRSEGRKRRVFDTEPLADLGVAVEARYDSVEMRDLLEYALEPLSLELRTVFVLFEFEEMTAREIATLVGVPVGTISSRLRRARELFAERAEELRVSLRDGEAG